MAHAIDEVASEEELNKILQTIEEAIRTDEPARLENEDQAFEELAAIDAWASLASNAVQALYAPGSPSRFRRKGNELAGWSVGAAQRLHRVAAALRASLDRLARQLLSSAAAA